MIDLQERTKNFVLRICELCTTLPDTLPAEVISEELLKSCAEAEGHYQAAKISQSEAEYVTELDRGLQELEKTVYWLELLVEGEIIKEQQLGNLYKESNELIAIFESALTKAKYRNN